MNTLLVEKTQDLKNIDLSILKIPETAKISEVAEICAYKTTVHPEWAILAGRLKVLELPQRSFSQATESAKLLLNVDYYNFVKNNAQELDEMIIRERDDRLDWFAVCTLIKSYLFKIKEKCVETPQQMFLRVAVWLWMSNTEGTPASNMQKIKEVYDDMSLGNYIHATPTLFNSGARRPQLSSCFLMTLDDNLESISKSWYDCAMISKNSGGIGIDITEIRHSEINNSNVSSGVVPMLKVHNSIMNYVDQARKRKGSAAIYLAEWHIDIFDFIEMKKQTGSEYLRARDLFYAVWVSDLFMKRVKNDEMYSFFCPNKAKGLNSVWGKEFEALYEKYENEKLYEKQVPARDLWKAILSSQIESGSPYMLFKDSCNRKSNQQNLGTIKCSNLCTEIIEYTSSDEIASCNLASVVLNSCVRFVSKKDKKVPIYDYSKLERLVRALTRNINRVIDINYYMDNIKEIKYANLLHRPIAIGVQGLADTFILMNYSFECEEARKLNRKIFETIYYSSVSESIKIARELLENKNEKLFALRSEWKNLIDIETLNKEQLNFSHDALALEIEKTKAIITNYSSYEGSPASRGFLQFDLWEAERLEKLTGQDTRKMTIEEVLKNGDYSFLTDRYDWKKVRDDMKLYGMRNSLLVAPMPTASSAQILSNNECFEPISSVIGSRTVLSGQFMLVNKHIVGDFNNLQSRLWNKTLANDIISGNGSVQSLSLRDYIPNPTEEQLTQFDFLKKKYKTVFELSQKVLVNLSLDRGRFVCQSQSFNCFMNKPTYQKLTSFLFYQWDGGAKTGVYYTRSASSTNANRITIDNSRTKSKKEIIKEFTCTDEVCVVCQ